MFCAGMERNDICIESKALFHRDRGGMHTTNTHKFKRKVHLSSDNTKNKYSHKVSRIYSQKCIQQILTQFSKKYSN